MNEYIQTSGITPIGTLIAFLGNVPPDGFLVCDGSTHNIIDYPEFADFLNVQFGAIDQFGGDGITTFGVPDLTDTFIKGSSTAGVFEDAGLPNITGSLGATSNVYQDIFDGATFTETSALYCIYDSRNRQCNGNVSGYYSKLCGINFDANRNNKIYGKSNTVTPKNISVLYCIKVK